MIYFVFSHSLKIKSFSCLTMNCMYMYMSDRPRDKTEKMAALNRCAVRMGPRFTVHWPR